MIRVDPQGLLFLSRDLSRQKEKELQWSASSIMRYFGKGWLRKLPRVELACFLFTVMISSFRIERHLEPLAIAANVTQSMFCRLDEVLLTFGALMLSYRNLRGQPNGDRAACDAILASLERRWSNADQEVFIAAVILNPFFKHQPFKTLPRFQPAKIYDSFIQLWMRFFPRDPIPTVDLYQNVLDYVRGVGGFQPLRQCVTACLGMSEQLVACSSL